MKILGIESSSLVASVGLLEDDIMLAEYTLNYKLTHSQTIFPMLDSIDKMIGLDLENIDAIAISKGPGSFTGLRIGLASAKGIALGKNKKIIAVPTLDAMAFNLYKTDKDIVVIMDARKEQVYTGTYKNADSFEVLRNARAISISELIEDINKEQREVIFIGDAIPVYRGFILENIRVPFSFAPAGLNRQRVSSLLNLASIYYKEGKLLDSEDVFLDYLRSSQAQIEKQKRDGK